MDNERFDLLAKRVGALIDRRRALAGAAVLAVAATPIFARDSEASICYGIGATCRKSGQCCSGVCGPRDATGRSRCTCPAGTIYCPSEGICAIEAGSGTLTITTTDTITGSTVRGACWQVLVDTEAYGLQFVTGACDSADGSDDATTTISGLAFGSYVLRQSTSLYLCNSLPDLPFAIDACSADLEIVTDQACQCGSGSDCLTV